MKAIRPRKWILMALLLFSGTVNAHIFLDPARGNDSKDGKTYANRVKTIDKAITLSKNEIEATNGNQWIIVCSAIIISEDMTLDGTTSRPSWPIHMKRCTESYCYYDGNVIELTANKQLTLTNIVIDGTGYGNGGNYLYVKDDPSGDNSCGTLVFLEKGTSFTINDGTILQHNYRLYSADSLGTTNYNGGAIESSAGAKVVMNGGRITDCKTNYRGGGIYLSSLSATSESETSSFTMNNGEIDHCSTSNYGGGIYFSGRRTKVGDEYVIYYANATFLNGEIHDCDVTGREYKDNIGRGGGMSTHYGKVFVTPNNDEDFKAYSNHAKRYGGAFRE